MLCPSTSSNRRPPAGTPDGVLDDFDTPVFLLRVPGGHPEISRRGASHRSRSTAPWRGRNDVAVLQELILEPLLDIHPYCPETLERLSFVKDPHAALRKRHRCAAFIMKPTSMGRGPLHGGRDHAAERRPTSTPSCSLASYPWDGLDPGDPTPGTCTLVSRGTHDAEPAIRTLRRPGPARLAR